MIETIFDAYKGPSGSLAKDEYRAFLGGIGLWGKYDFYTDDGWENRWPEECSNIQTTADKGADLPALEYLYTKFRAKALDSDFQNVIGVSSVSIRLTSDSGIHPT